MKRRLICLWFPRLAAERILRCQGDPARPFAVVGETKSALRLCSLNIAAERAGLRQGMTLTDARALQPDLAVAEAQPERDIAFLGALARWATRFSPHVAQEVESTDLLLDVTGCQHLFGGEAAMLREIIARLERAGLSIRAGLADTIGAAWAMAHYGDGAVIIEPGESRKALASLPVAALRITPEASEGLMRLGLNTIGDLARSPRASLARRFGVEVIRRQDQALGQEPEPLSPVAPMPGYAVRMTLPEPIGRTDDVMAGLDRLLLRLCATLETSGMAAGRFRLTIRRADGGGETAQIRLAKPGRDPAMIRMLFEKPVDGLDAGFGIDRLRLEALAVEPVTERQERLEKRSEADRLDALLSRLGNRVGFEHLIRFAPAESHIPERSFIQNAAAHSDAAPCWPRSGVPRPLTLFEPEPLGTAMQSDREPPGRFHWRGTAYETAAAQGPERIAPEWWLDDPAWRSGPRDYWRVETAAGPRLWLFRLAGSGAWFVQGEFG